VYIYICIIYVYISIVLKLSAKKKNLHITLGEDYIIFFQKNNINLLQSLLNEITDDLLDFTNLNLLSEKRPVVPD